MPAGLRCRHRDDLCARPAPGRWRWLRLDQGKGDGVLLVGANSWTIAFAQFVKEQDRGVMIADASKFALRRARADIPRLSGRYIGRSARGCDRHGPISAAHRRH